MSERKKILPKSRQPRGGRDTKLPSTVSRSELLIDGSDHEFRAFVHGMLAFAARIEAVRSGFAALIGLTGIQYTILISVGHLEREGDVSVNMLAGHLHLSGAFVTIESGKLLKRGLLSKLQDPIDRRRVCLTLTDKGCDLLCELIPVQVPVNDMLFGFLGASEFRRMWAMLDETARCGDRALSLLEYLGKNEASDRKVSEKNPRETRMRVVARREA